MKPGSRIRNVAVGAVYLFVVLAVVAAATPGDDSTPDAGPSDTGQAAAGGETAVATDGGAVDTADPTDPPATAQPTQTAAATAQPTQTAAATPTPEPSPDPIELSGQGQTATDSFQTDGGLVLVDLQHSGSSNFIVELKNANGETVTYLVNEIGSYDGQAILNLPAGEYFMAIQADGQWSAEVAQPVLSQADVQSLPAETEGSDGAVLGPFQFQGATRVTFEGLDDTNYAVWLHAADGSRAGLLINEIGPTGELSTAFGDEGYGFIAVESTGEWVIRIEQN